MHEKLIWLNDDIQWLFGTNIQEYDMKAASLSVSEYYQLLDNVTIERMKLMPKDQRTRQMGLIQRDNKEFSEKLLSGIKNIRRKFLETNGLQEKDIISLHSDAVILVSNHKIIDNIDGIQFVRKGHWSSYIRYNNIEMYYDNDYITFKNVPKEMLYQHTMGLTQYLRKVFMYMEGRDDEVFQYLSKFQAAYLKDKLSEQYYTPFGKVGKYKFQNLQLLSYIANIVLNESKRW